MKFIGRHTPDGDVEFVVVVTRDELDRLGAEEIYRAEAESMAEGENVVHAAEALVTLVRGINDALVTT